MIFMDLRFFLILCLSLVGLCDQATVDKTLLKKQAYELFMHGYRSYMDHAFPADELMPLSCRGRIRGITPSRGDVDDSLGNFSLTLVDTLDTLVVMGAYDEFESAVRLVVDQVQFNSDIVVSVFETNIRVLGGLLSGHIMADLVKTRFPSRLEWYSDQLLRMAVDIANRLLPAFNTTSGIPYSRINLRYGMLEYLKRQKDTCTACGGTMLLEMAALSRLTGNPVYEQKAHKAMDFLWAQRHRGSDLMGTVLNVHSGDWVRRESGIGAGIDSYYEYCLKAYILLGDKGYLDRFNKHYDAIMRYVHKGPLFVDVHMHRPTVATRSFMDALLAFWPGLQVLKGDVKKAIETHEMLYQVVKKHKFLPEAFTHDFQVHWGEHPLRPEFIESTYFLYRATRDPHYLEVAKLVMDSIESYVKVPCGFAGVKDVRTMNHEDRMDSFVLSETFKYLYMIFAETEDLIFNPDDYVLTTEAHFLPLNMGEEKNGAQRRIFVRPEDVIDSIYISANPVLVDTQQFEPEEASQIRERTKSVLEEYFVLNQQSSQPQCSKPSERLRAWAFSATNSDHIKVLRDMGIEVGVLSDGRMQITHNAANAANADLAKWGMEFVQEMVQYHKYLEKEAASGGRNDRYVQILSSPYYGHPRLLASPAQFGFDLKSNQVDGLVMIAEPYRACSPLLNPDKVRGRIALVERSDCMFQEKARNAQKAGAIAVIVIDHNPDTTSDNYQHFAMAGDQNLPDDIIVPVVFLHGIEGGVLRNAMKKNPSVHIALVVEPISSNTILSKIFKDGVFSFPVSNKICEVSEGDFIILNHNVPSVTFNFRLGGITQQSEPIEHQAIVERHVVQLQDAVDFDLPSHRSAFFSLLRYAAYEGLELNVQPEELKTLESSLKTARLLRLPPYVNKVLPGEITKVHCSPKESKMLCVKMAV